MATNGLRVWDIVALALFIWARETTGFGRKGSDPLAVCRTSMMSVPSLADWAVTWGPYISIAAPARGFTEPKERIYNLTSGDVRLAKLHSDMGMNMLLKYAPHRWLDEHYFENGREMLRRAIRELDLIQQTQYRSWPFHAYNYPQAKSQAISRFNGFGVQIVHQTWENLKEGKPSGGWAAEKAREARRRIGLLQQAIFVGVEKLSSEEHLGERPEIELMERLDQLKSLLAVAVLNELWAVAAIARFQAAAGMVEPYLLWFDRQGQKARSAVNARSSQSPEAKSDLPFEELVQVLVSAGQFMPGGNHPLMDRIATYATKQWSVARTAAVAETADARACQEAIKTYSKPYTFQNLTQCVISAFYPSELMGVRLAKVLRRDAGHRSASLSPGRVRESGNDPCGRPDKVYGAWFAPFSPARLATYLPEPSSDYPELPIVPTDWRHFKSEHDGKRCVDLHDLLGEGIDEDDIAGIGDKGVWCLQDSDFVSWTNGSGTNEEDVLDQKVQAELEGSRKTREELRRTDLKQDIVVMCLLLVLFDTLIARYL
ncbi:hypothetical protein LTR08_003887 [Meristemomyces frigidus]|nr:hypothetical protein LTR08_003887 [Meristemomyces frigidus]